MIDIQYNPLTKTLEITGMANPDPEHYTGDYDGIVSGFYYNGTHSSLYHVDYIPDASDCWFAGADWEVYDAEVAWHHGGYYYGNSVRKREFTLKCFYEEITEKQREDIRKWLHRNTSGHLMFDDKPFVYWNVRPTRIIEGQKYLDCGRYSGVFDVTFCAYDPFGYLTRKYNTESDDDNATDYCDLLDEADMPESPSVLDRTFNVYNPGRETCGLSLKLSGSVSNPIEFLNTTNKTRCIINDLPPQGLNLEVDGDTGKVMVYTQSSKPVKELAYSYHDRGIVRLEPGMNTINILEKNNNSWVTPTSLSLSRIEIDYAPRVL